MEKPLVTCSPAGAPAFASPALISLYAPEILATLDNLQLRAWFLLWVFAPADSSFGPFLPLPLLTSFNTQLEWTAVDSCL